MSGESKKTSGLAVCRTLGWVSFQEILRDKILYNILVLAALLLAVGFIGTRLTFARPDRIILDFGLMGVNLSCTMIAIFAGASVIGREFERRTIFVALSRPISKFQFLLGKFCGVALVILMNWTLLAGLYLIILAAVSSGLSIGAFGDISATLLIGLLLLLFQSWLMAALAILFSTISTTSLSAVFALGFYLVGNNVDQVRFLAVKMRDTGVGKLLDLLAWILPDLGIFNLRTKVTYSLPVTGELAAHSLFYGVLYTTLLLTIAGLLIQRRES